jgi:M3 family oligoendopeptidase
MNHLSQLITEKPTLASLQSAQSVCLNALDTAKCVAEKLVAIRHWDSHRKLVDTWASLVYVRFSQDTRDAQAKADRDYADALWPDLTELSVAVKQRLLADPDQPELARQLGHHLLDLWQLDVDAFNPAMKVAMEQEAKLCAQYTELCASASIPFKGETQNLSSLRAWLDDPDRDCRHEANQLYWGFYYEHRQAFDTIFDELTQLRHGMGLQLGFKQFTPLGYRRMQRLDYDAADVAQYRQQVLTDIVPLCQQIIAQRRERLKLDHVCFWDEGIADLAGNPIPPLTEAMLPAAQQMFDLTHPALGQFFSMMTHTGLIDLDARPGKAGGGYCTFLASAGWPFIFCNSNGSMDDAVTLIHEIGHAFQAYNSQHVPISDLQWPTSESAEIHSMALEFLTFDSAHCLFGAEADRYQRIHLEKSLLFLPYGVAIDHFQHLVYENPQASAAERHQMWQWVEKLYMPWRDYGDLPGLADGSLWQQKQHIYNSPFYYIDYTLALCCALQFWVKSRRDAGAAMADYMALCTRGGTAPFGQLVKSAGLVSPFEAGALKSVAEQVKAALGLTTALPTA